MKLVHFYAICLGLVAYSNSALADDALDFKQIAPADIPAAVISSSGACHIITRNGKTYIACTSKVPLEIQEAISKQHLE